MLLLQLFSGPGKFVFGMVRWLKQELCTKAQSRARGDCINSSGFCGSSPLLQLWRLKREFLISDLSAISCEEPPHCIARAVAMETIIFLVVPFGWKSPVSNERRRSPAAPVGQGRAGQGSVSGSEEIARAQRLLQSHGQRSPPAQPPSLRSSPGCSRFHRWMGAVCNSGGHLLTREISWI